MGDRILVVDDDFLTLELLSGILDRGGYQVSVASDSNSAMFEFHRVKPHLVVLDQMVDDVSGLELCQRMRSMSAVPIVLLSAYGGELDVVRGLASGADDYLEKPFRPNELLARVKAQLRRSRMLVPSEDYMLRFGGHDELVINPEQRRIQVRGQKVDLTKTEFEVLLFMAQRKGHVLSSEEIYQHVWNSGGEVGKGNVRWYIWRLREKIEEHCPNPRFIFTERGIGYRFSVNYAGTEF